MGTINGHIIKLENYVGQRLTTCDDCPKKIITYFYAELHNNVNGSQSWLHAVDDTDAWAHALQHNTQ